MVISIAERYLQYENLLGGVLILILIFAILNNAPWQLIHILDQVENVLIWGTVSSTILTHQIDSLWVANMLWFVVLGMICITKWRIWENVAPVNRSDYETSGFQPVKMYEQLLPRQKKLSDELVNLIRSHDSGEPLTICVAGKWGAGKTSIVNGTINFLKTDSTSCKYEVLYINTMDLDTSASLFAYVFDRLRDILKKRGAYVGLGSEYKQFIASAVGKITDTSIETLLENHLFPSSKDYRTQMKELEGCISATLKNDKILIVVDDVERCDIEKAQQFIFLIKEIATLQNCITIFLTDYEYLNQRVNLSVEGESEKLNSKNGFFYDKFFNYRIDIPLLDCEESLDILWQELRKDAEGFRFRQPHELFAIFSRRLLDAEDECVNSEKVAENQSTKKAQQFQAEEMIRLRDIFNNSLLTPRMLVKFRETMKGKCRDLRQIYMQEGAMAENTSKFFSLIRFDEILFLLVYIEVCTPYDALCLKEQGTRYLRYLPDEAGDTRKLLFKLSEDLLYSARFAYRGADDIYRYNEAIRFVDAYLNDDLSEKVNGFSSRDAMWLNAIQEKNKEVMRGNWAEMVRMVAQNYGWKEPELGEEYLKTLFSFAREELLPSEQGKDIIFTIFDKSQHNHDIFSAHIAVFKFFEEELGAALTGCPQSCIDLLNQFSPVYFWHRVAPICSAVNFVAPPEYSREEELQRRMNDAPELMLSTNDPIDNLEKILKKIRTAVPSLSIPKDTDVFLQFRFLATKLEEYLTEAELLEFNDIKDRLRLTKVAIEDMECFIRISQKVKGNMIPTGSFSTTIDIGDIDKTILRFKNALKTPYANAGTSLQLNLTNLFNAIRFSKIELSESQYQELQSIVTASERLYGPAAYNRKILADHRKSPGVNALSSANMEQH